MNHVRARGASSSGHAPYIGTESASSELHNPMRLASISVAVDPVALVTTECIAVTSAMRKHARWAHSSVSAILGGGVSTGLANPLPGDPRRKEEDDSEALASRWGLRGKKGKSMQDNPLMSAFSKLRSELKGCKDIKTFDTPSLLHPFLQVIRSSSTSAPITSLALIAVTKFLSYGIISTSSPRLSLAMQLLSSAITHCRFEASDTAADDVVLLRILKLMERMISGPVGDVLGDESVCEMMETGLSMCSQNRLSEVLRRAAEISMVSMCQVIFERLKHLELEAGDQPTALDEKTKHDMESVKMDSAVAGNEQLTDPKRKSGDAADGSAERTSEGEADEAVKELNASQLELPAPTTTDDAAEIKPYSLPSIRELFRVLVDLLDPHDKQRTDTMRIMALRIVDVALEVAGPSIANHPSLASLAKDTLCRHLFQLVRSENMAILNESLRVAGTLLATCRKVLKLQQELFLSYMITCLFPRVDIPQEPGIDPKLYAGVPQGPSLAKPSQPQSAQGNASGRSTPVSVKDRQKLGLEGGQRKPDAREAMIENVGALVRIPSFMTELFVNYDCDIDRNDLCMDMVGLLSRNAIPDSASWSTTNVPPLCLDSLLWFVQSMADRLDDEPYSRGLPSLDRLRERRRLKKVIIKGASKFNESPKAGIAYLASQGVIDDPNSPHSIAHFLRATSRIDKKILGEFISKKNNEGILDAFMESFDFAGQRIDEALRQLLHTFRLPGESALIERIVTVFTEKYCRMAPEGIVDKDAAFVLTYAIIMLNTDQHNPNLKATARMTILDFAKNLRGVNGGEDFDPEFLQAIYDSIKTNEIILPEEHNTKHAYDHGWKELLVKVSTASDLIVCDTNIFDADVFTASWKPIVATLSYVFMSASDDAVFSRVITGFHQCAQIAAKYGVNEALDRIIVCLSSISTLASETPPNTSLNTEVQAGEKSVMVSETAVRFGRDFRAQLATVVLFKVINGNETAIREGWTHVVRIFLNLFVNSLTASPGTIKPAKLDLPPIPLQPPVQVIDRGERNNDSGGLFSTLSSYVSSFANDEPPEPSDQELEYTLCTVDCITSCNIEEVFANISFLPPDALNSLVSALLAQLPENSAPRVIVVKSEPSPARPNGQKARATTATYDSRTVFILELATILTLRDDDAMEILGKDVADALQSVIRDAPNFHYIVNSRIISYLFKLLKASGEHDFIRAPVVLHQISSFDPDLLQKTAGPLLSGLTECIAIPSGLRNELVTSPDFWSILDSLHGVPEEAPKVFTLVEKLIAGPQSSLCSDNYERAMELLNNFASAGSIGTIDEQRRDHAARRGVKTAKPKENEVVVRGITAIHLVFSVTGRIPTFIEHSHLEATEAWNAYWSPIFRALTLQCLNPCREIRHHALSALQRTLLSKDLTSADHKEWTAIFGEVLFPLINQLLKPEVFQSDPVGMGETRVQAATLLCKIFLHYLVALSEWEGMLDLWVKILNIMDRLMNSGQGDTLEEAVPESLKNILLVMASGGYLAPPNEKPEQAELWNETWTRLDRFLPNLFTELFPEATKGGKKQEPKPKEEEAEPAANTQTADQDDVD